MPTLRALLRALPAGALALAAACADSTSTAFAPLPAPALESPASVRLECTAAVAARSVTCAPPPGAAAGARADRIYGAGAAVKLTSSSVAIVADSFTFNLTVTNLLEYPVGTTDGVNPEPNGIRVFFVDGIHTTQGTGSVTVANADGVDAFTAAGQAYFRYLGVLQPGATTAARKWKLRFDPGVQTFAFGLLISTPVPPGGGTVKLTILQPLPDSVLADSVVVRARIDSSPASIQSVKAFVAGRSVAMAPYAAGLMRGTLPLTGLAFGTYPIRVHAVTVRADTGNAYVSIRIDALPRLIVAEPVLDRVARPNLRVDADCVDDDPAGCASVTARLGNVVIASGTTGVHTDVSLAAQNETRQTVQIDARDSGGHLRTYSADVYVQSGELAFVDSAGAKALDLDSNRLLFSDAADGVWLRDRGGGGRTVVDPSGILGPAEGRLHSHGAMLSRKARGHVLDWRSGVLTDLTSSTSGGNAVVAGEWAAWGVFGVFRRDLAAGTILKIASGGTDPWAAANGDVAYLDGGVKRFRGGVITPVPGGGTGSLPVTDGVNVVYMQSGRVTMWDGTSVITLSNLLTSASRGYYAAAGGWVAYTVVDGGGATQLRVRAPDGTDRQVTTYGSGSLIRALSAEGALVFGNSGTLYALRAPFTAAPRRIGRDWFTVRFRGTELQLYLGNSVFTATY